MKGMAQRGPSLPCDPCGGRVSTRDNEKGELVFVRHFVAGKVCLGSGSLAPDTPRARGHRRRLAA